VSDLNALVTDNAALVAGGLALVAAVLALALLVVARRARRLEARLDGLTRGEDGRDLAAVLDAHLARVQAVSRRQDELDAHAGALDAQALRSLQGVGFVRFNTFEDTGGNQSFALALLDESESGFVVSSLHSRTATRLYAKAVLAGKAETSLSSEENEAMDLARAKRPVRPAAPTARASGGRTASLPSVPAPADSSAAASAAKAAPAAAPKTAPPPAAAPARTAAPARAAAPIRTATPVATSDRKSGGGGETTGRTAAAKGQSKGNEVAETDPDADSERTGRKPGRPTAGELISGQGTDTRGS